MTRHGRALRGRGHPHLRTEGRHRQLPPRREPPLPSHPAGGSMRIITIEEHFSTPAIDQANATALPGNVLRLRAFPQGIFEKLLDLGEGRIRELDAAGIDLQVVSLNSPGVQLLEAATAVPLARDTNDLVAEAVSRHPGRLAGFAALPTADANAAAT